MKKTGEIEFVTVTIGDQLFGLAIDRVHDVFAADRVTRVPMARDEIAGILNLRGRIVTMIDMRRCLDLPRKTTSRTRWRSESSSAGNPTGS